MSSRDERNAELVIPEAIRWKEPVAKPHVPTELDRRIQALHLGVLDIADNPMGGTVVPRIPTPPPPPAPSAEEVAAKVLLDEGRAHETAATEAKKAEQRRKAAAYERRDAYLAVEMADRLGAAVAGVVHGALIDAGLADPAKPSTKSKKSKSRK